MLEVVLEMKNVKRSVRFSEEEEMMIESLKKAFSEQHHLELSDSDVLRQALRFMYCEATKKKEDQ